MLEQDHRDATEERALKSAQCKQGLIARSLAYDLRGHNANRIVELARRFSAEPSIVGQAFMELILVLTINDVTKQNEVTYLASIAPVLVDGLIRHRENVFVQEQVCGPYQICTYYAFIFSNQYALFNRLPT